MVGDFLQFKPVNPLDPRDVKMLFELPEFHQDIDHTVELKTNYRIRDPRLKQIVEHLETGELTDADVELLNSRVYQCIN